ncbi:hypothetical protein C5B94_04055 [Clavibacter michiganensis]|uniref:hypothetical protein n=1 Tax=Clavibacter michiganensis TaxID=28447 RepID=UPI000CE8DED7|nr:hypothetical protein [Clavibacter michiganensis]PPF56103.1 hypothetical protein C5B94_04055 [Clavibacter michiganensis]
MDVVTLGMAEASAAKKYASKKAVTGGLISNRLAPLGRDPQPEPMAAPPAISWSAAPSSGLGHQTVPLSPEVTLLGARGTWNTSFNYLDVGAQYTGLDLFTDGDTFEVGGIEQVANGSRLWFWIDGVPATAAPLAPGITTAAGGNFYAKLTFPSAKRRRITLYVSDMKAWQAIAVPVSATLTAAPPMINVAFVADSFFAGSGPSPMLQAMAVTLGRILGVNVINASTGGTGYLAGAQTFGSAARIARVAQASNLAAIVFLGSVNDGTITGLNAAAAATYAAYAAAFPGVPQIVFGPQPSSHDGTILATRAQAVDAIRQAALAAPSVVAFRDMIGFVDATVPPAWASGTTYAEGARVTYKGSIYSLRNGGGTSAGATPGTTRRWSLETYMYTGTGKVGSTVGDGTRDLVLSDDALHPSIAGSNALSIRIEGELRAIFAQLALAV